MKVPCNVIHLHYIVRAVLVHACTKQLLFMSLYHETYFLSLQALSSWPPLVNDPFLCLLGLGSMQAALSGQHSSSLVWQLGTGSMQKAGNRQHAGKLCQGSIQAAWPRQHAGSWEHAACRLEEAACKQLRLGSQQTACLGSTREA